MDKLPSVKDLPLSQKTVLLRTNYDVSLEQGEITDTSRIDESLPTLNYLLQQQAKVVILSHLGRPEGKVVPKLSLKPVVDYLSVLIKKEMDLINDFSQKKETEVLMLENLRFWPEEESNDPTFTKQLASLGDLYVNDAFAVSHRSHASIVGLPSFLPSAFGFDFLKETDALGKIQSQPEHPVVIILGGVKEDKLEIIEKILPWSDQILVGGKLPQLVKKNYPEKVMIAQLNEMGKDITLESIKNFASIIKKAGTIVWAGPLGLVEEEEFRQGTREIAQVVMKSPAFKVVGGGDTEAVLTKFNLVDKIDYISSGGGAMFEYLAQGTLPGIKAILERKSIKND